MLPHGFSYTVENEEATPYSISKNPAFLFSLCPLQIGQHHHCHTCANCTHICPPSLSLTADLYTRIPNYLPGALTAGFYPDLEFNMSLQTALVCSLPQVWPNIDRPDGAKHSTLSFLNYVPNSFASRFFYVHMYINICIHITLQNAKESHKHHLFQIWCHILKKVSTAPPPLSKLLYKLLSLHLIAADLRWHRRNNAHSRAWLRWWLKGKYVVMIIIVSLVLSTNDDFWINRSILNFRKDIHNSHSYDYHCYFTH